MQVGTISAGETVIHSLRSLTNEHGDSFNPNSVQTNANSVDSTPAFVQISELEVRANFRGHEVPQGFSGTEMSYRAAFDRGYFPRVISKCWLLTADL